VRAWGTAPAGHRVGDPEDSIGSFFQGRALRAKRRRTASGCWKSIEAAMQAAAGGHRAVMRRRADGFSAGRGLGVSSIGTCHCQTAPYNLFGSGQPGLGSLIRPAGACPNLCRGFGTLGFGFDLGGLVDNGDHPRQQGTLRGAERPFKPLGQTGHKCFSQECPCRPGEIRRKIRSAIQRPRLGHPWGKSPQRK